MMDKNSIDKLRVSTDIRLEILPKFKSTLNCTDTKVWLLSVCSRDEAQSWCDQASYHSGKRIIYVVG